MQSANETKRSGINLEEIGVVCSYTYAGSLHQSIWPEKVLRVMHKNTNLQKYERKVTGAERFFSHAPFSTVTMVARIKGNVSEDMLKCAVGKVQQRHALLRVRMEDRNGFLRAVLRIGSYPVLTTIERLVGNRLCVDFSGVSGIRNASRQRVDLRP